MARCHGTRPPNRSLARTCERVLLSACPLSSCPASRAGERAVARQIRPWHFPGRHTRADPGVAGTLLCRSGQAGKGVVLNGHKLVLSLCISLAQPQDRVTPAPPWP